MIRRTLLATASALMVAGMACSASPSSRTVPDGAEVRPSSSRSGGILRLAWPVEPDTLAPKLIGGSGNAEFQWLFTTTLTVLDWQGARHPRLAAEIPTQANGGWVVNLDGTMVTTYRLRPNVRWHDGTPLTAADFVFAFDVYRDKELPIGKPDPESLMERVDAADDHTLVIRWRELYLNANVLGYEQMIPLPRHVLETKYRTNKPSFLFGQEWTSGFISTGPFKVERWTPGASMLAAANMDFVLGPPKLDSIEIRFIPDSNAQIANLLSGEVDLAASPGVRIQDAVIARNHWGDTGEGYIKTSTIAAWYVDWQFREVPNWQRAISDIRVRQALLHALDREGLNDTINLGFSPVIHGFVSAEDPLFPEIDRVITKYPYDPNRSMALLAEVGWHRTAENRPLTNAVGQALDVELFTTAVQESQATIIVDNWKAVGVNSSMFVVPQARARDGELGSNFSAARLNSRTFAADNFIWTSDKLPTPENQWSGSNRGSFVDPEVDRLQSLRLTSLDENQRRQATIALIKRLTDVVAPAPFLYSIEVIVARKYVNGPLGRMTEQNGVTWNVHEWEIVR